MSIKLGSTNFGSIYLGSTKIGEIYLGSVKVYGQVGPLVLPARTFRVKYKPGTQSAYQYWDSTTLVDATNNIWDMVSPTWGTFGFQNDTNLLEVLGGNSTGILYSFGYQVFMGCTALTKVAALDLSGVDTSPSMGGTQMFQNCSSLTEAQILNTSNLKNCRQMFEGCTSLTRVPLFDTSGIINCRYAFNNCYNVESGALALYTQMSTQTNPPREYDNCFTNCGSNTVTGRAELDQIPESWGGTLLEGGYDDDFE